MATPLPPEATGEFTGDGPPVQDLLGTGLRELFTSMLDAATAIRLGKTSSTKETNTYLGTVVPSPQEWRSPSESNSADEVNAGVVNAGNAPQAVNKTTAQGGDEPVVEYSGPPRIARSLPQRRM